MSRLLTFGCVVLLGHEQLAAPRFSWSELFVSSNRRTKKVAGIDLSLEVFAYVGCPKDTSTWLFPVLVRGDEAKTRNLIKSGLHHFDAVKKLPEEMRQEVWNVLRGAALANGLHAERRTFAATAPEAPSLPGGERPTEPVLSTKRLKELTALADARADAFLAGLGLD
jgi:hypothetical protein